MIESYKKRKIVRYKTIRCNKCTNSYGTPGTMAKALKTWRAAGWSIGKEHICPWCLKK